MFKRLERQEGSFHLREKTLYMRAASMGTDLSITAALQKSLSTAHGRVDRTEAISHTIIPSIPNMAFLVHIGGVCP